MSSTLSFALFLHFEEGAATRARRSSLRRPPVRRKAERRDENGTRTRRVLSQPIPLPSSLSPKMELMLTTRRRFRRRRDIENNVTSIIIEDGSSFSLLLHSYWRHHLCRPRAMMNAEAEEEREGGNPSETLQPLQTYKNRLRRVERELSAIVSMFTRRRRRDDGRN